MTSANVLVTVCVAVIVLLIMTTRRTEAFNADARQMIGPWVGGRASGNVALRDSETVTLYAHEPGVTLQLTGNDVVLLPHRVRDDRRAGKALVELVNAYQILLTNTLSYPTITLDPYLPSKNSVTESGGSHVFIARGAGRTQLQNYIHVAIPRVGYTLKFTGRLSDIRSHDITLTPRDTLVTPEVGKFADILGVTALCNIQSPDFAITFMLRAPGQRATYVSLVGRGADMKLTSFNHNGMRNRSASDALSVGDATRDHWIRRNRKVNVQTFKGALAGAATGTSVKMEVQPGRVRCFVEGASFQRAFVIAMPILDFPQNLSTHPVNPPQMAWRSKSATVMMFPFPMGDLSFDGVEVIKRV
jgi:hypothetical protein